MTDEEISGKDNEVLKWKAKCYDKVISSAITISLDRKYTNEWGEKGKFTIWRTVQSEKFTLHINAEKLLEALGIKIDGEVEFEITSD